MTPFRQGERQTFVELLCDGYFVENIGSMKALLRLMDEKTSQHSGRRLLATLDDFGQACYTSGHSIDTHELDSTEGHDLSGVDAAAFEDGEHLGYLTTASEFFIRRANLTRKAAAVSFADVRGEMFWGADKGDGRNFFELNAEPDTILDEEIYIQAVPVDYAYEAICAFPNGYFSGDLSPMQVFAVSRRFEETYGYSLFGIGASYVGLRRTADMSKTEAQAMAADFLSLHQGADDARLQGRIEEIIRDRPIFLFCYATG